MFDLTSSKLLILGIVALLVIGPKDLPALLRTIGKYVGMIKRQAAEFRAQFDEAMRESELAELKKSVESMEQETAAAMREAQSSVEKQLADARLSVDEAMADPEPGAQRNPDLAQAPVTDADAAAAIGPETIGGLNGSANAADTATAAANDAVDAAPAGPPEPAGRPVEKSGA
jgi:sec-independent protein translocase protein TatB